MLKLAQTDQPTNRPTNQQTNQPTDRAKTICPPLLYPAQTPITFDPGLPCFKIVARTDRRTAEITTISPRFSKSHFQDMAPDGRTERRTMPKQYPSAYGGG
ncbi:hypothetical protein DPMN_139109 [Dreissena polymorpha]|uniref:Uncharacterized protein n=1 Tax=Dreissena polymorpha TaxID=45954 RepID=A0A9D4JKG6_DREPO|nr:hypothetical protein DPMN_139109 [Dreissena polymorpha]